MLIKAAYRGAYAFAGIMAVFAAILYLANCERVGPAASDGLTLAFMLAIAAVAAWFTGRVLKRVYLRQEHRREMYREFWEIQAKLYPSQQPRTTFIDHTALPKEQGLTATETILLILALR